MIVVEEEEESTPHDYDIERDHGLVYFKRNQGSYYNSQVFVLRLIARDCSTNMICHFSYYKARASLEKTKSKADKTKGPKKVLPLKPASEAQYWITFVRYLKKYDKLPVVAFTLSRAKCDRNADMLAAIDLTTQEEKNYISYYFKESVNILKEEDRELPQVFFK